MTWQPIETAPRDGTRVLTCCRGHCDVYVGHVRGEQHPGAGWWYGDNGKELFQPPTHWMHLPRAQQ